MTTVNDLFGLEYLVRRRADSQRKHWESVLIDPECGPATQSYARSMLEEADKFDRVGDLLVGLQGGWDHLAPLVRAGYVKQAAEDRRVKDAKGREAA